MVAGVVGVAIVHRGSVRAGGGCGYAARHVRARRPVRPRRRARIRHCRYRAVRVAQRGLSGAACLLGREALAQARAGGIDVVVLDVGLPDLGGFEACRELRRFSQVPVIFLTARNDEIDRVLGLELGADDDMAKPFSLRELVARMRSRAGSGTARSRSRSTATAAASTTATPHWT
ncbi:response regulator [Xanthomonas translucens]|uniref:response regulator n=1 Tax=Xanthomonas campestris pv. translucens TaxID=343 RepID=UPI003CCEEFAC